MGDGIQSEEKPCPFWQKKCSEVNAGQINCNMLLPTMGVPPGGLAPKPMLMCKIDYIMGRCEAVYNMMQQRPPPLQSKLFPFTKG